MQQILSRLFSKTHAPFLTSLLDSISDDNTECDEHYAHPQHGRYLLSQSQALSNTPTTGVAKLKTPSRLALYGE